VTSNAGMLPICITLPAVHTLYTRDWYSAVMNNYVTVPRVVTLCGRVVINFQKKYNSTFM